MAGFQCAGLRRRAGQIASEVSSNASYDYDMAAAYSDFYNGTNNLNQYGTVAGSNVAYDANGNMTTDHRGWDYVYAADSEGDRLRSKRSA